MSFFFGLANLRCLLDAGAVGRAVAALGAFRSRAIEFHELGVINLVAESTFDRAEISFMSVRRHLHAAVKAASEIVHEMLGKLGITTADKPIAD